MDIFRTTHQNLVKGTSCTFMRYLHNEIDWSRKVTGIFGARGVGKTTLMLQHIKLRHDGDAKVLYLNLDDLWFQRETLSRTVKSFCESGGTYLFLDNVQYYPSWMAELGELLGKYAALHVVFAVSNLQPKEEVEAAIQKDMQCYTMRPMSFREFLAYESVLDIPPISLEEVAANHAGFVRKINKKINVVPLFRNYLEHGCYPFYWRDPDMYYNQIANGVRDTLDIDLPLLRPAYRAEAQQMKHLLMTMAGKSPKPVLPADMIRDMEYSPRMANEYVGILRDCGYIRILEKRDDEMPYTSKMYIGNTNLLAALFGDKENRRNMGETFFVDQLSYVTSVQMTAEDEFLIADKYTFMVGDPLSTFRRIQDKENAFAAVYGLPKSITFRMPAWVLGFLY